MKRKKCMWLAIPIIVGLVISAILVWTILDTASDDWICFKGSPERTSSNDVAAPDTRFLNWQVDIGSELYSSPVVKDDKVFQVALERLYCIDLDTGNTLWTSDVPVYQSTPFVTDDKVVITTNRGISALSIEDGEILWEYVVSGKFREFMPLQDYIVSSPVLSSGKVIVGAMPYFYYETNPYYPPDEIFLICVDESTGKEHWYMETRYGVHSSPCAVHGKVFAASREMICVDVATGKVVWNTLDKYPDFLKVPVEERYAFEDSTPALYHGIVVTGSSAWQWEDEVHDYLKWQKIVFIDQYTGEILWEWVEEGLMASSPAVFEGKVYLYSFDGIMRCISFLEGEEVWKTSISQPRKIEFGDLSVTEPLWPSPTVADNKVYIGSVEGVFYCLDADTGEILWSHMTEGEIRSAPAVVPGKVLISSTDRMLYCFGIDPEAYMRKAKKYVEDEDYEKAEKFFVKAYEYASKDEKKDIEESLDFVRSKKEEYQEKIEKRLEAEQLMDEADKILWDNEFLQAKASYVKAKRIFEELNDEFLSSFCESRLDYIQKRMDIYPLEKRLDDMEKKISEKSWFERYWWLVVIMGCVGVISIYVLRKY